MSYQHGHRRVPLRESRSRERSRKVAKSQKRARKEFSDVFVNPNGRVAAVVDEAVLAHASGWYQASGSTERGRLCRVAALDRRILRKMTKSDEIQATFLPVVQMV
jgi:hypothetical protein